MRTSNRRETPRPEWVDGIRLDTGAPNLEWWYFDATLDDGTGLSAVLFCTKDGTRPHQPLADRAHRPRPDGTRTVKAWCPKPEVFRRVQGRLRRADGTDRLHRRPARVPHHGARPRTSRSTPAPRGHHGVVRARRPAICSSGPMTSSSSPGRRRAARQGDGHLPDRRRSPRGHRQGLPRPQLDEHRDRAPHRPLVVGARGGRYTFITAHIVATKKYGYTPFHWYMLARDGKPIADDGSKMTFTTHGARSTSTPGSRCRTRSPSTTRMETDATS